MAVITISRELGSEGDRIADLLCQELGYCRVDKDMLTHIAEEAGVDVEVVLAHRLRGEGRHGRPGLRPGRARGDGTVC